MYAVVLVGLLVCAADGFSPAFMMKSPRHSMSLGAGKLTAAEIIARARKAAGVAVEGENEEGPPQLFADKVYEDIQTTLIMLDKRITAGSLTQDEVRVV